MATFYIELTNINFGNNENIQYEFNAIQNLDRLKESGYTVASARKPENSVAYNFSPPKITVPIQWQLVNGVNKNLVKDDKSRGTLEDSGINDDRFTTDANGNDVVRTIEDQILFLRDYLFNGDTGARWRFYGGNFSDVDGDGTDEGTPVYIENTRLPQNVNNLFNPEASIELGIGDVV